MDDWSASLLGKMSKCPSDTHSWSANHTSVAQLGFCQGMKSDSPSAILTQSFIDTNKQMNHANAARCCPSLGLDVEAVIVSSFW